MNNTATSAQQPLCFDTDSVHEESLCPSPAEPTTLQLHRIHAVPASGRGGASLDIADLRWRGDGRSEHKAAVARRLAVCWNVCEGFPTSALEDGVLVRLDQAVAQLLDALNQHAAALPPAILTAARFVRQASKEVDAHLDTSHGRLHDCPQCLGETATSNEDV